MEFEYVTVGPIGTNCYILPDLKNGAAAVIDPGAEPETVLAAVRKTGCRVKLILLTHGHFDHIGAVAAVKAATGAPVFAPAAERGLLLSPQQNLSASFGAGVTVVPDRLLSDGEKFPLGGLTITMLSTPGHTAGSCSYLCGDLLFSGDTLFCGDCGRTDMPTGSADDMRRSLQKLFALPGDYTVCPGHGPRTTLTRERAAQGI